MRTAWLILKLIALAAVAIALIGGLIGGLIAQFATSHGFVTGIPYGIILAGLLVAFLTAQTGSRSRMASQARWFSPPPQAGYQFVLGGLLAFGGGLALLILVGQ
jgi:hypothetical protein